MSVEKNKGMIATLDLSRVVYNDPKQFFWTYESLGKLLSITEREKPYTNVYLSLNAFRAVDNVHGFLEHGKGRIDLCAVYMSGF